MHPAILKPGRWLPLNVPTRPQGRCSCLSLTLSAQTPCTSVYLQTAGYLTLTELARTDVEVGLLSLTAVWISNLIRGTEEMSGKLSQVTPPLTWLGLATLATDPIMSLLPLLAYRKRERLVSLSRQGLPGARELPVMPCRFLTGTSWELLSSSGGQEPRFVSLAVSYFAFRYLTTTRHPGKRERETKTPAKKVPHQWPLTAAQLFTPW